MNLRMDYLLIKFLDSFERKNVSSNNFVYFVH